MVLKVNEKLEVVIEVHSNGIHVQQIYTGFRMLERNGYLKCKKTYNKERISTIQYNAHRTAYNRCVIVNMNGIKMCYDLNDSSTILEEFLNTSDFYFKRSYSNEEVNRYGELSSRIFPFGLNYLVYCNEMDWNSVVRTFKISDLKTALKASLNYIPAFDFFNFVPRLKFISNPPTLNVEPKVLFLARLWDPDDLPGRSVNAKLDRTLINETRIECIKSLNKNFGKFFFGGLADTPFARRVCPELIISDKRITRQAGFLELVRTHSICIATMGLFKSNGYKLAEYAALSRAIVTEPLQYLVTGDFKAEDNYLEFNTPDECVAQVGQLFDNKQKRELMMIKNWEYYKRFMAPDCIIRNTLEFALQRIKYESEV